MSDPLDRDLFPDRPDTPDFWRLSEIGLRLDGAVNEGGQSVDDITAEVIDPQSLIYFARHRAGIGLQASGLPEYLAPFLAACILDGIVIGIHYQTQKEKA